MDMKKCIVAGGVLIESGKVLLIKHKKLNVWVYPGGHMEPGEIPPETAEREFEEETGIRVKVRGRSPDLTEGMVYQEVYPISILLEDVRYPGDNHLHYDLIYPVERVGGQQRDGEWFTLEEVESLETYENIKDVLRRAFKRDIK